jgi:hypothetical protein
LNTPIAPELRERFDVVYDGGTLEHVFNFPVALQNCMELTRVGGHVFIHTVTNNYCGHGFYQFSPELFFRAFSALNGFAVERMVLHAIGPYGRWYEVSDPEQIRSRVELITFCPMQLLIHAKRIAVLDLATPPQQSDFVPRWDDKLPSRPDNLPNLSQPMAPSSKLAKTLPNRAAVERDQNRSWFAANPFVRNRKSRPVKRDS